MNARRLFLGSLALVAFTAAAQSQTETVKPIAPGEKAEAVAINATNANSVSNFNIGTKALKVVSLESQLNGDINATTMILVGEKAVGGLAGYDSAFLLGPTAKRSYMTSAKQVGNVLKLMFYDIDGHKRLVTATYNAKIDTLKLDGETLKKSTADNELEVANLANDLYSVTNLKIGKMAYKIVSLDSGLNGDLNSTTIVAVGEGGVGGEAGYEAAFQLGPDADANNLTGARLVGSEIELSFSNLEAPSKFLISYDQASQTLKERKK